ncbi:MAG: SpoIIE family protein phosphatase [Melioribacteraceae bacterium]|nr:SpoIIE family protein phosphatase [Melioribacteraceae bacterium]
MDKFEHILAKYRSKLIAPVVLFMAVLLLSVFYFIFEVTPQPNDECIWDPQMVTKDSVGYFFQDVKLEGVTWKAGIRDGDQLLEINGKPILKLYEASHILNSMSEGDSALYKVSRDEEIFETKVEVKKLIQFGGLSFAILALIWLIVGFVVIKSKDDGIIQITFFRIGLAFVLFASFNLLIVDNIKNPLYEYPILVQIVDHLWTFGTLFLPFLILKFFWIFPKPIKYFNRKWIDNLLFIIPTFLFLLLVLVKYIFVYQGAVNVYKFYGVMAVGSILSIFISGFIGLISLFVNYLKIKNEKDRKPIFVILVAYTIGILAAIYTFVLVTAGNPAMRFNQPEVFLPLILIALLPVAFGYSIFKYSLMDVSDVVKTTLLYGFATISIAATYFFVIYILGQTLSSAIGTEYQGLIAGVIFVAFAIIFQSTKDKFQNLIIRKFYPEQFAYQKVLCKFSNDVVTIVGLENILKSTTNTFIEALKLAVFGIVLKNNSNGKFELREGVGLNNSSLILNTNEESLISFLKNKRDTKQALVIDDSDFNLACPESAETLIAQGIYTVIPLIIKNKIVGLLLFGLKYSGSRFAGKDIELLTAAANQTAVSIENARLYESEKEKLILDRDLENARKIQNSLLPSVIPKIKGLDISGTMLPAMQVGGDYFDVIKVSESKVFAVVGDVSGKGLAASFYMSKLQTMVKLYCNEESTPFDVLTKINSRIFKEMEKNWFITCTIALFNSENKSVKICRAGHTPISVVTDGVVQDFIPSGIGMGLEAGRLFEKNLEQMELPLTEKSLFCLYSDGVNEAMNSEDEMFGINNFNKILISESNLDTSIIQEKIISSLKDHRGTAPQNDDITFVLVKINNV